MPTVNVYFNKEEECQKFAPIVLKLKEFLAEKLSGSSIKLTSKEISVRFLSVLGGAMIGNIELEITAHAFKERIDKEDEICLQTRDYIMKELAELGDVRVWLKLSELGHSW